MRSTADALNSESDASEDYSHQREDLSARLVEATQKLYMSDRRGSDRLHLKGCLLEARILNTEDPPPHWFHTNPVNFSHRGCGFETLTELEKGQLIWLRISPDPIVTCLKPFCVGAEVRHLNRVGSGYSVGVEFRMDVLRDLNRFRSEESVHRLEQFLRAVDAINKSLAI